MLFERLRRLVPTREAVANNRWLRWLGPTLLHPTVWHFSRRTVALGAAIGVFFAFITPIAQIPLSAAASVLLRANIPAAMTATFVNSPPTFVPVYAAAWRVGSWVLGEKADESQVPAMLQGEAAPPATGRGWWADTRAAMQRIGKPLLVGTLIFAVGFSLLAYVAVDRIWVWRVRARRQRRLGVRG
jgi:uncharacterized protein (DUF2062 family)